MDSSLWDTDSPDYDVDRLYEAADTINDRNKDALLSLDRAKEAGPADDERRTEVVEEESAK